jgi:simple sugar transport system ATP-binding protein
MGDFAKSDITREEMTALMAGGAELRQLTHELARTDPTGGSIAQALAEDVATLGIGEAAATATRNEES